MTDESPIYSPFFGVMGATSAMVFGAMGAAYGTAKERKRNKSLFIDQ